MARVAAKKVESFEKELWNAAVQLRGNVAPADYKHYVLPLLFLRYLSLGYEKRRDEIKSEIRETRAKYDNRQLTLDSLLDDPDEYARSRLGTRSEAVQNLRKFQHRVNDGVTEAVDLSG